MATVKFYVLNEEDRTRMNKWKEVGRTETDEVEGFLDRGFDKLTDQNGVWLISFRETFYSTAKRVPGIYHLACGCLQRLCPPIRIVLEEVDVNRYKVRIYGHKWFCVKHAYDLLRRGKFSRCVRWDEGQTLEADKKDRECLLNLTDVIALSDIDT